MNRLDEIVIFHRLTRENMDGIVKIQLAGLERRLADRKIALDLDAAVAGLGGLNDLADGRVDGEAVVVGGDLDAAGGAVEHGLVELPKKGISWPSPTESKGEGGTQKSGVYMLLESFRLVA